MPDCRQFTYSNNPGASDLDAVRFLVGDIDGSKFLLDDREVTYAITLRVNLYMAAAYLADHIAAIFARKVDITVGPVSKSWSKAAEAYSKKAAELRREASKGAVPSFPAIAVDTKEALESDDTLTKPNFEIGMFDDPSARQLDGSGSDNCGQ